MAEVLVVGKKISEMELVTDISGNEKIPTGVVGDKAVTTGQLVEYLNSNGRSVWGRIDGDLGQQTDLQNEFISRDIEFQKHITDLENPHQVTKSQLGLGNVDNTADVDKPISNSVKSELTSLYEKGAALPYEEGVTYEENAVVVKDGVLQQWKAGEWEPLNRSVTKFLSADTLGLTKWDEFKKPPYTSEEYTQAYNNGENITRAINEAAEEGYTCIVLERGNYPVLYASKNRSNAQGIFGAIHISSPLIRDFDLNKSTLFTIYDSDSLNQYTSTWTNPPYKMDGAIISFEGTRFLRVHNGELRGDQYMRSFTDPAESSVEQSYGMTVRHDNWHPKVENMIIHGFRGDSLQGRGSGYRLIYLESNWEKGGVDLTTGEPIEESQSFRTELIDTTSLARPIIDNLIHLNAYLSANQLSFRDENFKVFFYDYNGQYITYTLGEQSCPFRLARNTRYIRLVSYNDERTQVENPHYKTRVELNTGASFGLVLKDCILFNNMRGGVSNTPTDTTIENCNFSDIGTAKNGFPVYGSTTRYGVNNEERNTHKLTVKGCLFQSVGSAILANSKFVIVKDNIFRDVQYSAVTIYGTKLANITGNSIINCRYSLFGISSYNMYINKVIYFNNNHIYDSFVALSVPNLGHVIHKDNYYNSSRIELDGSEGILVSSGNIYKNNRLSTLNAVFIRGALTVENESIIHDDINTLSVSDTRVFLAGTNMANNYLYTKQDFISRDQIDENIPLVVRDLYIKSDNSSNYSIKMPNSSPASSWTIDPLCQVKNITLDGADLQVAGNVSRNLNIEIVNCEFKNLARLNINHQNISAVLNITFTDCTIDVTGLTDSFIYHTYATKTNVKFVDCRFVNRESMKEVNIATRTTSNFTYKEQGSKYENLTKPAYLKSLVSESKIFNVPLLEPDEFITTTVDLTDCKLGDTVGCSFTIPNFDIEVKSEVTSDGVVTVRFKNTGLSDITLGEGTLKVFKVFI